MLSYECLMNSPSGGLPRSLQPNAILVYMTDIQDIQKIYLEFCLLFLLHSLATCGLPAASRKWMETSVKTLKFNANGSPGEWQAPLRQKTDHSKDSSQAIPQPHGQRDGFNKDPDWPGGCWLGSGSACFREAS